GSEAARLADRRPRWPGPGMPGAGGAVLVPVPPYPAARAGAGGGRRTALSRHEHAGRPSLSSRLKGAQRGYPQRMCADFVYLASASPRRRQLLEQIGVRYQTLSVSIDESVAAAEAPSAYVSRLAETKAEAGRRQAQARGSAARPVLAADTAVLIYGEILGKPTDAG